MVHFTVYWENPPYPLLESPKGTVRATTVCLVLFDTVYILKVFVLVRCIEGHEQFFLTDNCWYGFSFYSNFHCVSQL